MRRIARDWRGFNYPAEFLQKLREGEFHPPAVRFRDPAKVLQEWGRA
jgi:hypothetical protein